MEFIEKSTTRSSFFSNLQVSSVNDFIKLLHDKGGLLDDKKIHSTAYALLINLITKILKKESSSTSNTEHIALIDQRLKMFNSGSFEEILKRVIPYRDYPSEKESTTGVAEVIKQHFGADIGKNIRSLVECAGSKCDGRNRTSAVTQCEETIGLLNSGDICYICNRIMSRDPMCSYECEHVLPVLSAITRYWLYYPQHKGDQELIDELKNEYGWSHKCCNQHKSNYDFILYDKSPGIFIFNSENINHVIENINSDNTDSYNCNCKDLVSKLTKDEKIKAYESIILKVTPLIEKLNEDLQIIEDLVDSKVGTNGSKVKYVIYMYLCKFKLFAAFKDNDFINLLLNTMPIKSFFELFSREITGIKD